MESSRRNRLSTVGAVVALVAVLGLVGWRTASDTTRWSVAQSAVIPPAPAPETGQMNRRRGRK